MKALQLAYILQITLTCPATMASPSVMLMTIAARGSHGFDSLGM